MKNRLLALTLACALALQPALTAYAAAPAAEAPAAAELTAAGPDAAATPEQTAETATNEQAKAEPTPAPTPTPAPEGTEPPAADVPTEDAPAPATPAPTPEAAAPTATPAPTPAPSNVTADAEPAELDEAAAQPNASSSKLLSRIEIEGPTFAKPDSSYTSFSYVEPKFKVYDNEGNVVPESAYVYHLCQNDNSGSEFPWNQITERSKDFRVFVGPSSGFYEDGVLQQYRLEVAPKAESGYEVPGGSGSIYLTKEYTLAYDINKARLVMDKTQPYTGSEIRYISSRNDMYDESKIDTNLIFTLYTDALHFFYGYDPDLHTGDEVLDGSASFAQYTVSYQLNTDVGYATMILTGIPERGLAGTREVTFQITKASVGKGKDIDPSKFTVKLMGQTPNEYKAYYTGTAITPPVTVEYNNKYLGFDVDYTVKFTNNVNPADWNSSKAPKVTITLNGNFSGTLTDTFTIRPSTMERVVVEGKTIANKNHTFVKPKITVYDSSGNVINSKHYDVKYWYQEEFGSNKGTWKEGTNKQGPGAASGDHHYAARDGGYGNGWNYTLHNGVTYEYRVSVTPKTGSPYVLPESKQSITCDYRMYEDISRCRYVLPRSMPYQGGDPVKFVTDVDNTDVGDFDYGPNGNTVEVYLPNNTIALTTENAKGSAAPNAKAEVLFNYINNAEPGTATLVVTGVEDHGFTGTVNKTFKIGAANLNDEETGAALKEKFTVKFGNVEVFANGAVTENIYSAPYTGSAITPPVTVIYNGTLTLTEGLDYTVKASNSTNPAEATAESKAPTVTITLKNSFTGTLGPIKFTVAQPTLDSAVVTVERSVATGKVLTPKVTVKLNGTVVNKKEYDVEYNKEETKQTGTVNVTVKGKGKSNSFGTDQKAEGEWKICKNIASASITVKDATYTGSPIEITDNGCLTVTDGTARLSPQTSKESSVTGYYVEYNTSDHTKKGTVKFTIWGTGDYAGSIKKSFKIQPAKIDATTPITLALGSKTVGNEGVAYTGKAIKPVPTVTVGSNTLKENVDYTVKYYNNTKRISGSPEVKITGKGNYTGSKTVTFFLGPRELTDSANVKITAVVTSAKGSPKVTVTVPDPADPDNPNANITLPGSSYKVKANRPKAGWTEGENAGGVTITGVSPNVTNDCTCSVYYGPALSKAKFGKLPSVEYTVPGTGGISLPADTFTGLLTYNGAALVKGAGNDYTVTYTNNRAAGTAKVTFTATTTNANKLTGSVTKTFKITARDVATAGDAISIRLDGKTVTGAGAMTHTETYNAGKAITPPVEVYDGAVKLVEKTDYTLSWKDNKKPGTATLTVKFKKNYKGTKTANFTITR